MSRWERGVWGLVAVSLLAAVQGSPVAAEEAAAPAAAAPDVVQENVEVALDYTLTVDGAVVESTTGKQPLRYVHGRKELIDGFEQGLAGMRIGESKDLTLAPEQAYGMIDPAAVVEVSKSQLPGEVTPEVGMVLRGMNPDGKSFRAKVTDIKSDTVVLDLNHPLAGKTLHFAVKVVDLKPASPQ